VDYVYIDLGVDSSGCFPLRARTAERDKLTYAAESLYPAPRRG